MYWTQLPIVTFTSLVWLWVLSQPTWQQSLELTLAQQHASALIDIMKTSHNIHTLPNYHETGPPAVTHCLSRDEAIGLYCCIKQDKHMFQDSLSRDRATLIISQLVCHVIRLLLYTVLKSKKWLYYSYRTVCHETGSTFSVLQLVCHGISRKDCHETSK